MSAALSLFVAGCANTSPDTASVNANLPQVTNVKTISGTTEIGLEWPSYAEYSDVQGFQIFRAEMNGGEMKRVAVVKDKYSTHFVDTKLAPETTYKYVVKTYGGGAVSESAPVTVASTTKLMDSVPFAQAIYGLPERIKIIWRPHPDLRVKSYVIERRSLGSQSWSKRAEVNGRLSAEYIDKVGSGQSYEYRIFVKTANGELSKPSEILQATTKNLPNGVSQVTASSNLPKRINISWVGTTAEDFKTYRVYSSRNEYLPFTLLGETTANSYDDYIDDNGGVRFYKVTAVDKDGLESPKGEAVKGQTLDAPNAPSLQSVTQEGKAVRIVWENSDTRVVKYHIEKSQILGMVPDEKFEVMGGNSFSDTNIEKGKTYYYKVYGVDEYGVTSPASNSLSVEVN